MSVKEQPIFQLMTNKQTIACLTFVGGFVDAAGYVMLYKLYTSAITGNIVAAVLPIYQEQSGVVPRVLVWLGAGLGAGSLAMYSMKLRYATSLNKWEIGFRLFSCELVALCVTTVVGSLLSYPRLMSWQVMLQCSLMATCMGIQNAAAFITIPNCAMTTAMTGNTIRFFLYGAEALVFWLASRRRIQLYPDDMVPPGYDEQMRKNSRQMARRFRVFLAALGPFVVGAIVAVPLAHRFSLLCLVVPTLVIAWVLSNIWLGLQAQQAQAAARKSIPIENGLGTELVVRSPMGAVAQPGSAEERMRRSGLDIEAGNEITTETENENDDEDGSGAANRPCLFEDANYEVQASIAEQRAQQVPQSRNPVVFRSAPQEV